MKLPVSIVCLTILSFTVIISTICEAHSFNVDPLQPGITSPNSDLAMQDRIALKQLYELYRGMDAIPMKRAPAAGFYGMRGKKVPGQSFYGMRGKKGPSGFLGMRGKKMESKFLLNSLPEVDLPLSLVPLPLQEDYWNHLKAAAAMKETEALSDNGAGDAAAARLAEAGAAAASSPAGLIASMNLNSNVNLAGEDHENDKRAPSNGFMGLRGKRDNKLVLAKTENQSKSN